MGIYIPLCGQPQPQIASDTLFFQTNNWVRLHQPPNEFRKCARGGPTRESEVKSDFSTAGCLHIGPHKAELLYIGISSEGNEIWPGQKYLANLLAMANMSIPSFTMISRLAFVVEAENHPIYIWGHLQGPTPYFRRTPVPHPGPDSPSQAMILPILYTYNNGVNWFLLNFVRGYFSPLPESFSAWVFV